MHRGNVIAMMWKMSHQSLWRWWDNIRKKRPKKEEGPETVRMRFLFMSFEGINMTSRATQSM